MWIQLNRHITQFIAFFRYMMKLLNKKVKMNLKQM